MIPQEAPTAEKGSATERYIVANLPCAEKYPEQIAASAPLSRALTKMALYDYSQLVVGSGRREIKGLISYRSVAQAFFQSEPKIVGDCIDDTVPHVKLDEPLFRVADLFRYYDAVLVFRSDKALSGIVTPFDIAVEFGVTAAPVLLIGQIEEQLRWLLENRLDLAEALIRVGGILAPWISCRRRTLRWGNCNGCSITTRIGWKLGSGSTVKNSARNSTRFEKSGTRSCISKSFRTKVSIA